MVVGESSGGRRFKAISKLGVPCREVKAGGGEVSMRDRGLSRGSGKERYERVLESQDIVAGRSRVFWGSVVGRVMDLN